MELRNNTILITGGTSGFGLEFAAQLQKLGNTILITGRNQSRLDETKKLLPGIHTFQSDVSDPQAIEALYRQVTQQFPDLNILINNAGEMRRIILQDAAATTVTAASAATTGLSDITREIDINLSGPIRMIQQFLPHLRKKASAAIVNVTSGLALVPLPLAPVYGATKSGLRSYTQSLRAQLKHTPVKVFELVAPGARTPLNDKFAGDV
ncbi:MAG TPA: SDR family NAD(P)-dependent oxidoreductase, partial [Puia sp.]|nr:SDR family NAD(P)-dependent oxidoreductase [Puia sp.]